MRLIVPRRNRSASGCTIRATAGFFQPCDCCSCCPSDCVTLTLTNFGAAFDGSPGPADGDWVLHKEKLPGFFDKFGCIYSANCIIDADVDGVHYIQISLFARVSCDKDGKLVLNGVNIAIGTDGSGPEITLYSFLRPQTATDPGCDQTITLKMSDYGGPSDASTVTLAINKDCTGDDSCSEPNGCGDCCPDTVCITASIVMTYTITGSPPSTESFDVTFFRDPVLGGDGTFEPGCFYSFACDPIVSDGNPCNGFLRHQGRAHIYCDGDGTIICDQLEITSADCESSAEEGVDEVVTINVDAVLDAPFTLDNCTDSATPTLTATSQLVDPDTDSGFATASATITLTLKESCDDDPSCGYTNPTLPCDTDCIDCAGCELCPTAAAMAVTYSISPQDCTGCTGCDVWFFTYSPDVGVDGVEEFSNIDCTSGDAEGGPHDTGWTPVGDAGDMERIIVTCAGSDEPDPGTPTDPTPTQPSSHCAAVDLHGTVDVPYDSTDGSTITYTTTITTAFGDAIFLIVFTCATGEYVCTITVNGHCIWTGSIFGDCAGFSGDAPGNDSSIANCGLGLASIQGTLITRACA